MQYINGRHTLLAFSANDNIERVQLLMLSLHFPLLFTHKQKLFIFLLSPRIVRQSTECNKNLHIFFESLTLTLIRILQHFYANEFQI